VLNERLGLDLCSTGTGADHGKKEQVVDQQRRLRNEEANNEGAQRDKEREPPE
jgi:hypothetical protein